MDIFKEIMVLVEKYFWAGNIYFDTEYGIIKKLKVLVSEGYEFNVFDYERIVELIYNEGAQLILEPETMVSKKDLKELKNLKKIF